MQMIKLHRKKPLCFKALELLHIPILRCYGLDKVSSKYQIILVTVNSVMLLQKKNIYIFKSRNYQSTQAAKKYMGAKSLFLILQKEVHILRSSYRRKTFHEAGLCSVNVAPIS
jgi:hypothetical protein